MFWIIANSGQQQQNIGDISFRSCSLEIGDNVFDTFTLTSVKIRDANRLKLSKGSLHLKGNNEFTTKQSKTCNPTVLKATQV